MIDDLDVADKDNAAAARLGSRPEALVLPERSRELANWLQFVTTG